MLESGASHQQMFAADQQIFAADQQIFAADLIADLIEQVCMPRLAESCPVQQ